MNNVLNFFCNISHIFHLYRSESLTSGTFDSGLSIETNKPSMSSNIFTPRPPFSMPTRYPSDSYSTKYPHKGSSIWPGERPTAFELSKPQSPPIYILDKCLLTGGNLKKCLSESTLYEQLFQEVEIADTTQSENGEFIQDLSSYLDYTSDYNHISGIPIDPNGAFINEVLNRNKTHYSTDSLDFETGSAENIVSTPMFDKLTTPPEGYQQVLSQLQFNQITNQLLDGNVYSNMTKPVSSGPLANASTFTNGGGLFAIGHGIFDKFTESPVSHGNNKVTIKTTYATPRPVINTSRTWFTPGNQNILMYPIIGNGASNVGYRPLSQNNLLIQDSKYVTKPAYYTKPSMPTKNSYSPSATYELVSLPSNSMFSNLVSSFSQQNDKSKYTTPSYPNSPQVGSPGLGFGSAATPSSHIQQLAKKHPHAHVIIGPPPKHLLDRKRINNRPFINNL